jgi:hypothetical protein
LVYEQSTFNRLALPSESDTTITKAAKIRGGDETNCHAGRFRLEHAPDWELRLGNGIRGDEFNCDWSVIQ